MVQVRFEDQNPAHPNAIQAAAEKERADELARSLRRIKQRVRTFFNDISYVAFSSQETAPTYAEDPLAWVLDGTLPPAPEAQPEPELSDDGADRVEAQGSQDPKLMIIDEAVDLPDDPGPAAA